MQNYNEEIDNLIKQDPYSLDKLNKEKLFNRVINELTEHHYKHCENYKKILDAIDFNVKSKKPYYDLPFIPVRLFKDFELKSIDSTEVVKTLTSSGTTGQKVSKIYLDRDTSSNQQKVLVSIVSSFLGAKRLPMIIFDCPSVIKNRNMFSARGAGILGFSMFGTERIYAFDDDMNINLPLIRGFLQKHKDENIFLFGFTFMIWQYFYKALKEMGEYVDLSKGILVHGGGWKKLISEKVTSENFRKCLNEVCGVKNVHDYYGMVEQTGSIYMECSEGYLHCSNYSDVIVRNEKDLKICPYGEKGIIEVVSLLPKSYPGHAILTEDEGIVFGQDDCKCGLKGKYFKILGRISKAEIRGCSDTYERKWRYHFLNWK